MVARKFGPDKKIIDFTKLVKKSDNVVAFDAKEWGEQYNKHTGDVGYAVTARLVQGPHVQENFKNTDLLLSYGRTAADTKNDSATKHFVGD